MKIRTLTAVVALALTPMLSSKAETIYALNFIDQIVSFDSLTPGNILTARGLTGLQANETLLGLDARPANGLLYALGSSSRLYTVDPGTGAATQVGTGQFSTLLNGQNFSFDFNPTVDLIRVTSDLDQNLRVNPTTAAVTVDTPVAYVSGDSRFGQNPSINGVAYSNNVAGATTTQLFGIDSLQNTLVAITNANGGTLVTRGALGIDVSRFNGFDISGLTGIAYLISPATSSDAGANLYTVSLTNGTVSVVGHIGTSDQDSLFRGMTVAGVVPEPSVNALLAFSGGIVGFIFWRRNRTQS